MPSENPIDHLMKNITIAAAHRISRRSFLTSLGKLMLASAGASILDTLPADRRVQAHSDWNCTDWKWCNMNGYPCACRGGSNTTCPDDDCNWGGNPWTGCCWNPSDGCWYTISYYDCCGTCSASPATCDCGDPDQWTQKNWCDSQPSSAYKCTLAVKGAKCQQNCGVAPAPTN